MRSVAYSRSDAISHPNQVIKKTSASVLGAPTSSSSLPLWEAAMYVDTQAACGEVHLTRNELRLASNHMSELGNGSFSPLEP